MSYGPISWLGNRPESEVPWLIRQQSRRSSVFEANIAAVLIVCLLVVVAMGVHIAIALGMTSALGVLLVTDGNFDVVLKMLASTAYESLRSYEFAVIPLCFLGTVTPSEIPGMSTTEIFVWFLVAFGLFRFFDVVKPFGIRASQRLPRGWGIVVDDALAALCVCGCLNLVWRWLGPGHEIPFQLTQTL